ncbi:MAG TPA: hypothetical protein VGN97_13405 [Mesorhizobium sp.]|jgi:hypothetical protein|nr:hypothetical protein [Mesorhizobium sp.]
MSITARYYLFPGEGEPLRIPQRVAEGLTFRDEALPQYANSRVKVLSAVLDCQDGDPQKLVRAEGAVWHFDNEGKIHEGLLDSMRLIANALDSPGPAKGKVVHLGPELERARLEKAYRWEPSPAHVNRVIDDIWPKPGVSPLKAVKGTALKSEPVSIDAKRALREASKEFWSVAHEIDRLKEPSLKGFIYAARQQAKVETEHAPLYLALAELGERRLEIVRRHRDGRGVWYALVEITRWDAQRVGREEGRFHERCEGRAKAEEAARRLLIEHASKLSASVSVDARVITDIEWDIEGLF